jgi:hypothetical protein
MVLGTPVFQYGGNGICFYEPLHIATTELPRVHGRPPLYALESVPS